MLGTVSQLVVMLLLASSCSSVLAARLPATETRPEQKTMEVEEPIPATDGAHHVIEECVHITSASGTMHIKSEGGSEEPCGLYLSSDANTVIEIQLRYLNVPCHTGGLIALVDGWDWGGELWPSPADHRRPTKERVLEYCGSTPFHARLRSQQNVALLQYRLPAAGSALSIRVRHLPNPTPCNQLLDGTTEVFTLRNFGQRRNCTLFSMNPAEVQILPFHVGAAGAAAAVSRPVRAIQPSTKCAERGWPDYVEMGEVTSLDTARSTAVHSRLCGISISPGPTQSMCGMFVTRLVSSGRFDNLVRVRTRLLPISLCFADYELPDELDQALKEYSW